MTMPKLKARHAYGKSTSLKSALNANVIDAYDILLLDSDTAPKIGWVSPDGETVIVSGERQVVSLDDLPSTPEDGVVYIVDDYIYLWNGRRFVRFVNEDELDALTQDVDKKADSDDVDAKIEDAMNNVSISVKEF